MPKARIKRALLSAFDKTGIVEFAKALVEEFHVEIISTGGTASLLKKSGVPVTMVEQVTGLAEMMDGRVKTLHPKIHAAILADRDNAEHMRQLAEAGIAPIDLVAVKLYPFEKTVSDPACTFEQAIEMIDIGGPCMLRAAAKNHRHVCVCAGADSYGLVLDTMRAGREGHIDDEKRRALAHRAFLLTQAYDARVSAWLGSQASGDARFPADHLLEMNRPTELRYGENPHQAAARYEMLRDTDGDRSCQAVPGAEVELSYNNFVDAGAAEALCEELARELGAWPGAAPTSDARSVCVFIKHTNACGVGVGDSRIDAYQRAYSGDPNAAMGGILACSFPITSEFAGAVMDTYARWGKAKGAGGFFVEVWLAPKFEPDAVETIRSAKAWGRRVRLSPGLGSRDARAADSLEYKTLRGGVLVQSSDAVGLDEDQWKVVTRRGPTPAETADLRAAWLVCKHTKSNAVTICKDQMLIGNGAGQMSRVMSCRIATWLAADGGHAGKLAGSVAASDAFFPFSDGPAILMDAGVTAIIQPGGSKRDADTIAACDEHGVAMIHTGTRHFKH